MQSRHVPQEPTARSSTGDERWQALEVPTGDRFAWDDDSTYVRQPAVLRGHAAASRRAVDRHRGRARARRARRLGHDRPHLAAGAIKTDGPAGKYLQRARRRAEGLQLLRLAARQPRGDGARHVRERPPAQPARARHRGRRHAAPARRRGDVDLRRGDAVPAQEGVPLVVLAGKEYGSGSSRDWAAKGTEAARRPRRDRRELRAHPPLEPRRHGRPAAAVPRGRDAPSRSASPARRSSRSPASPSRSNDGELPTRGHGARRATRSSRRASASTRRRRRTTSATAGSCRYVLRQLRAA